MSLELRSGLQSMPQHRLLLVGDRRATASIAFFAHTGRESKQTPGTAGLTEDCNPAMRAGKHQ
jgi:hypothetical protein